MSDIVVTIDGPAGAGKSSLARRLANRLGFHFLDTGAMYRAVTWAALRSGTNLEAADALDQLAHELTLEMSDEWVTVNGHDVTQAIRSPEVTQAVSRVADHPHLREFLSDLQRGFARNGPLVTEGRDQGTIVFPTAVCKIFLTASPTERARRRHLELQQKGIQTTLEAILAQQAERDERDAARPLGRLEKAPDAIEVCTDGLSADQVLERLEQIVRQRLGGNSQSTPSDKT